MDTTAPEGLIGHFSKLEDPRIDRNKKHELIDVTVLCVCAVVSGARVGVTSRSSDARSFSGFVGTFRWRTGCRSMTPLPESSLRCRSVKGQASTSTGQLQPVFAMIRRNRASAVPRAVRYTARPTTPPESMFVPAKPPGPSQPHGPAVVGYTWTRARPRQRAAEGDDGRHDPAGDMVCSALPNFDQRLSTTQGVFYGGKLRRQHSLKRGIGGIAHSQPHHLQSGEPSRPFGKICVLRPDYRPHLSRFDLDCVVRGRAEPEIVDVNGAMAFLRQPTRKARRQLCIDEEMHGQAARMTRCEVAAAP